MGKKLFLIHGRSHKPAKNDLESLWIQALKHGVERDNAALLPKLAETPIEFIYYGDISGSLLESEGRGDYDPEGDLSGRRDCLQKLCEYTSEDFNKETYQALQGSFGWEEGLADLFSGALSLFRLSDFAIKQVAPDMGHYWNPDLAFGTNVRAELTKKLKASLLNGDDVCLIAHSLGSIISYDVLWKFSYYSEHSDVKDKRLSKFISIGSPLGDETVKRRLKGARANGERRYPRNIRDWVNIAAHDDYVSHDHKIADDFKDMLELGLCTSIEDRRIYNLSIRGGSCNQHHGAGYLVEPTTVRAVCKWLEM